MGATTSPDGRTPLSDRFTHGTLPGSDRTPAFSGATAPRYEHEAATVVTGRSQDGTPRKPAPPVRMDTPPVAHEPVYQWKIRSPVGLVYDFPDLAALKSWLSSRDSVDGMSASRDGGVTWMLLSDFSQLRDALPKSSLSRVPSTQPVAPSEAKTTMLSVEEVTQPRAFVPPKRDKPTKPAAAPPARPTAPPPPPRPPSPPSTGQGVEAAKTQLLAAPRTAPVPSAAPSTSRSAPRPSLHSGARAAITTGSHPSVAVRGATSGQPSIRRETASTHAVPGRPVRSSSALRAGRAGPRKAGLGTYVGLVVVSLVLIVLTVQLSGLADFYQLLGLRKAEAVDESRYTPVAPAPVPPVATPEVITPVEQPEVSTEPTAEDPLALLQQRRDGQHPHAGRIIAFTNQARQAADEGRVDEAIEFAEDGLVFDRSNAELVCLLADLHREAGSLTLASEYADRCDVLRSAAPELSPEAER